MKPHAPHIARQIIELLEKEKSIHIQSATEKVIKNNDSTLPDITVADLAANLTEKVRTQLNKIYEDYYERRVNPPFKWGEYDKDIIVSMIVRGVPVGLSSEPEEARFRLTEEVRLFLCKIDPRLFEILGHKVLDAIGADAFTTRSSQDEGVDFGGILSISPHSSSWSVTITARVLQNLSLRIVGQAKRYNDTVKVKEVRELQGIKHHKIIEKLASTHIGNSVIDRLVNSEHPLVLLFITTDFFTRHAKEFAQNIGMLLMDGEQVAQLLLHLGVGCKRDSAGCWEIDSAGIIQWIKS